MATKVVYCVRIWRGWEEKAPLGWHGLVAKRFPTYVEAHNAAKDLEKRTEFRMWEVKPMTEEEAAAVRKSPEYEPGYEPYSPFGYCGECGERLTPENMWSEYTCRKCAEELGLPSYGKPSQPGYEERHRSGGRPVEEARIREELRRERPYLFAYAQDQIPTYFFVIRSTDGEGAWGSALRALVEPMRHTLRELKAPTERRFGEWIVEAHGIIQPRAPGTLFLRYASAEEAKRFREEFGYE